MNNELNSFIESHRRLFVLTGAGCSANSGIPDYRDANGDWKRTQPVRFQAFVAEETTRRRYWARIMIAWRRFGEARPNDAHRALAGLEAGGQCEMLLTQNVDRLHQAAGSRAVIDLHGRLDRVRCMSCSATTHRAFVRQAALVIAHNAQFDRRFCERLFPVFAEKPWACSFREVGWADEGFESARLSQLANAHRLFFDGHRALHDYVP
jgi:NAD-dependent SIR2 family protein deacetylase